MKCRGLDMKTECHRKVCICEKGLILLATWKKVLQVERIASSVTYRTFQTVLDNHACRCSPPYTSSSSVASWVLTKMICNVICQRYYLTGVDSSTVPLFFFGCLRSSWRAFLHDWLEVSGVAWLAAWLLGGVLGVLGSFFYFIFILLLQSSWQDMPRWFCSLDRAMWMCSTPFLHSVQYLCYPEGVKIFFLQINYFF